MNSVLGKGIDALFASYTKENEKNDSDFLTMLDPRLLKPNPYQPRRVFDEEALKELSASIKTYGLIQPVVAQKDESGQYFIIAGERRTRASILAGLSSIPVILTNVKDESKLEVALIENIQREDLNPIEEAKAYQTIIAMGNLTQEELSERVGKSRPSITNSLRLLQLSGEMQEAVKDGKITSGHAKALLGIEDAKKRQEVFNDIIEEHLSVRATEQKASSISKQVKVQKNVAKTTSKDREIKDIEEQFIAKLGTKVTIKGNMESGMIEISYFSKENLEEIYNHLMQ